ncbi:MAG: 5-formyltetrahydrofolate cyclo-ligase [Thermofilum sp.]
MSGSLSKEKEELRRRVYSLLLECRVARPPFPIEGRIPNFVGAEVAARRLTQEKVFEEAEVVFSNPDSPQRPVREAVLRHGKLLVMASPRLRRGFIIVDPRRISPSKYSFAATIRGAFSLGETRLDAPPVDLKVAGSVAVDARGGRVGKGGGYSDLEYAILRELGLVGEDTPIVTTVHDLQVVERVPMGEHDVPVDWIFTPTRAIRCTRDKPRPPGIIPAILRKEEVEAIPLLKILLERRKAF